MEYYGRPWTAVDKHSRMNQAFRLNGSSNVWGFLPNPSVLYQDVVDESRRPLGKSDIREDFPIVVSCANEIPKRCGTLGVLERQDVDVTIKCFQSSSKTSIGAVLRYKLSIHGFMWLQGLEGGYCYIHTVPDIETGAADCKCFDEIPIDR